ncbi:ABC transporter permease [Streptomyces capparidis]
MAEAGAGTPKTAGVPRARTGGGRAPGGPPGTSGGRSPAATRAVLLRRARELALVPALLLLLALGPLVDDSFLTERNIISILGASAALAMVVLAESLVLITGKFDLSLESVVGIAPAIGALLVLPAAQAGFGTELPTWLALLAVFAVGGAVGGFNGLLVVKLRLNAFIVTLAMLIVLRGLLVGATEGRTLFGMPEAFHTLATTTVLTVPVSVWLAAAAFAAAGFVLKYHRWGRALYAIGGNADAARAAGIRVERMTLAVYVVAGLLAAVGGLIQTGYVGAINANQGQNMIFTVFAAAVIGGVSLDGGRGTMFGALTGVLLLGVVQNLLTLAQVESFWIQAIYGGIILLALMIARVTTGRAQD